MRTISPTIQAIIDSGNVQFYYLIELYLNNTYYITSYATDIDYNNNTYTANGGLLEVDPPRSSSVLDREAYNIVLTDHFNALLNEIRANVVGKRVVVRVGLIDPTTGTPITNLNEVFTVYSGYVDSPEVINDWDNKYVTFQGTSPMADLDLINSFMTSRDDMKQRNPNDTSFDEIYDSSELDIKWGKI